MILSALVVAAAMFGVQDSKPIELGRTFAKGERLIYDVKSSLHTETRVYGSPTFMPADQDLAYRFTSEVKDLKADGIAVIHYTRPTITETQGETFDSPSKTKVTKIDLNFNLTVSPINEILDAKNLSPKAPGKGGGGAPLMLYVVGDSAQNQLQAIMGKFVVEIERLALNVGSLDSAVDFNPKLPLDEVKVGDTWKKTVGYEPQTLQGREGKQAVQRLDYVFTYKGVVTVGGRQFYRVSAALALDTDLAEFINQIFDAKPEDTHLKSMPLTLKQSIDFDLDMATKRTVAARSSAEGGFKINVTDVPDEPVQERTLKGSTEMHLVSVGVASPPKVQKKQNS